MHGITEENLQKLVSQIDFGMSSWMGQGQGFRTFSCSASALDTYFRDQCLAMDAVSFHEEGKDDGVGKLVEQLCTSYHFLPGEVCQVWVHEGSLRRVVFLLRIPDRISLASLVEESEKVEARSAYSLSWRQSTQLQCVPPLIEQKEQKRFR